MKKIKNKNRTILKDKTKNKMFYLDGKGDIEIMKKYFNLLKKN